MMAGTPSLRSGTETTNRPKAETMLHSDTPRIAIPIVTLYNILMFLLGLGLCLVLPGIESLRLVVVLTMMTMVVTHLMVSWHALKVTLISLNSLPMGLALFGLVAPIFATN